MNKLRDWKARHPLALWRMAAWSLMVSITLGVVVLHAQSTKREVTFAALDRARTEADNSRSAVGMNAPVTRSYVSDLPSGVEAEQMVQRLAETALVQAVVLTDSRVEPAKLTSEADLPRASVTFGLRGAYPAIKATLAETLARTGHATLHSLSIRRDSKPEVEAQVVLSLWLRPAQAGKSN